MNTLIASTEEVPISEHEGYYTPRNDWGVHPAYWTDPYDEEEQEDGTYDSVESVFIPEDRSGWIPEWDGKSWADLDREFSADPRNPYRGVATFLRPLLMMDSTYQPFATEDPSNIEAVAWLKSVGFDIDLKERLRGIDIELRTRNTKVTITSVETYPIEHIRSFIAPSLPPWCPAAPAKKDPTP